LIGYKLRSLLVKYLAAKPLGFYETVMPKSQSIYAGICATDFVMRAQKFVSRCATYFGKKVGV